MSNPGALKRKEMAAKAYRANPNRCLRCNVIIKGRVDRVDRVDRADIRRHSQMA